MRKSLTLFLLAAFSAMGWSQETGVLAGRITDSITGEPLVGAGIITGQASGTVSGRQGEYFIRLSAGPRAVEFRYLGYRSRTSILSPPAGDTLFHDVRLQPSVTALDEIVVSAGRYEQRLSDVMVSVDIIKPERIANTGTTSLESILKQSPGVEILDGQPSIRGGSGYSYGAGSRVLVLMDGLPILSGDVGDVKWDYLPVENIQQVEILKGASSVLYGSSALNGVFHIRTRYPVNEPQSTINIYSGLYLNPSRKETVWWKANPLYAGMDFSHSRKIRDLDLVVGGNLFEDQGYRETEYSRRARMNVNLRHSSRRIRGMRYGINMYGMRTDKSDFLLWQDSRSGALRQNPLSVSALRGNRFNLDPFLEYAGRSGDRHSLKSRFFHIGNDFPDAPDKNNKTNQAYGEYLYKRKLAGRVETAFGASGMWTGSVAELYGDHSSMNFAVFGQADGSISRRLNASLGIRFERYLLDGEVENSTPVLRAGINYRPAGHTYIRASFGQGYRFPSVAEKYTATSVGSLRIYPNPALRSERGWSAEAGVKQALKRGEWSGYLDLSLFWTEYTNMIEFVFDLYPADSLAVPSLDDYGFMAQNVGHGRIRGIELTLYGSGKIGRAPLSLMAGYTFIDPVDLDLDDPLKYRNRHSFKSDLEISIRRFILGGTIILNSRMLRIDDVFTDPLFGNIILPGFPSWWDRNNTGYAVLDARVLCNITSWLRAGLVFKNAFNREYAGRPGDIQPPGNISLRLTAGF